MSQYYVCKLNNVVFSIYPLDAQGLSDAQADLAAKYNIDLAQMQSQYTDPSTTVTGVNVSDDIKGIKLTFSMTTTSSGGIQLLSCNESLPNYYNIDIFTNA